MTVARREPTTLARAVDDQCLAVLAAIDDLRQDLPGAVHDARVAVRKLRSTLVVFGPLFDERTRQLEGELRWFASELGAARDVQMVRDRVVTATRPEDPETVRLLAELDAESDASWARAAQVLSDPRTDRLRESLHRARLGSVLRPEPVPTPTDQLRHAVAAVLDRARKVLAGPAEDRDLHRLRKRIKRVRFATETWRDTVRGTPEEGSGTGRVRRRLEDLQDLLGEHQDAVVTAAGLEWIATRVPDVRALADDLARQQRAAAEAVRARLPRDVGRLLRALRRLERRTPGVHLTSS